MSKLKRKLNYLFIRCKLTKTPLYRWFIRINQVIFHGKEKTNEKTFGELNPDKTFYVIQLENSAGIFSTLCQVLFDMRYAEEKGYVPVVDMLSPSLRDEDCAFTKYFVQKTFYTLDEVYQSKHVILSGIEHKSPEERGFTRDFSEDGIRHMYDFINKNIDFSPEVWERVALEEGVLKENTLGFFLRETDYTSMQPYYHARQPEVEEVIAKVSEFISGHTVDNLYVVTEDWNIYCALKDKFGDLICITGGEEHFIKNYNGKKYIAEYVKNPYNQNLVYITRIILLSRCKWLIASKTNGSKMAVWLNNTKYDEMFLFDKGFYQV